MNPRGFLNFFKSKTGKLVVFGVVFGGGLVVFSVLRDRNADPGNASLQLPRTNRTDRPQVVQTVERPMEIFRPPPPKAEVVPVPPRTNEVAQRSNHIEKAIASPLAPISLFADTAAGVHEAKAAPSVYAPFGRLIPCETVITVDSASIRTPIVGLITEDVYHGGRLVIPAGTELHGTAQTDRARERIASGSSWTLVWQTGEELRVRAIALDREFSGDQEGWGITDGSAGLRGRLIKTDDLAEIKLFAATLLSGAASALTEQQPTIFGNLDSRSLNNAPLRGAQDVLKIYSQRILDAIVRDGFYVRVPSGKQFYLYVLQTIDRAEAGFGEAVCRRFRSDPDTSGRGGTRHFAVRGHRNRFAPLRIIPSHQAMKILSLIALLLATSCASRPIPRVVMETLPSPAVEPLDSIRYAELIHVYHVGRYVDPNQPLVMYEQLPVYRVEAESRWKLRPGGTGSALINSQNPPLDSAYAPAPTHDVVLAELNRQKDATERIMREATQFARSYDELRKVITEMTAVAKNHTVMGTRLAQTEGRLVQLEQQLQQVVGPITAVPNDSPTKLADSPEPPNP